MPLSQSVPAPNTQELSRVVVTEPVGAPEAELKVAVAPTAPEPLLAVVSAPAKATTVMDEAAACAKLALRLPWPKPAGATAGQIPAWPGPCLRARPTARSTLHRSPR